MVKRIQMLNKFNHLKAGQYGVYADVAYFRSWIDTTVSANGGAAYCPGEYSEASPALLKHSC